MLKAIKPTLAYKLNVFTQHEIPNHLASLICVSHGAIYQPFFMQGLTDTVSFIRLYIVRTNYPLSEGKWTVQLSACPALFLSCLSP